jgi:hypothetical protein
MEGSLVAYKVFTNGSVLQASEINDNLMRQSVMVFTNAAARSAAITVPLAGMLSFLQDTGTYESYNGTAWGGFTDVARVSTVNFTGVTNVNLTNVFSATYVSYQIFYTLTSGSTSTSRFQLRTGAGSNVTTNYSTTVMFASGTTVQAISRPTDAFYSFNQGSSDGSLIAIHKPFLATNTSWQSVGNQAGAVGVDAGANTNNTSYPSLAFTSTAAVSGSISVFGMKA